MLITILDLLLGPDLTEIKLQMSMLRTQSRTGRDNRTISVLLRMISSVLKLLMQVVDQPHRVFRLLRLVLYHRLRLLLRVVQVHHLHLEAEPRELLKLALDLYQQDGNSDSHLKADHTLSIIIHAQLPGSIHEDSSSSASSVQEATTSLRNHRRSLNWVLYHQAGKCDSLQQLESIS